MSRVVRGGCNDMERGGEMDEWQTYQVSSIRLESQAFVAN